MNNRLSRKKRLVFSAAFLLIILGSAELALRVHDFGFYFNYKADLLGLPLLDLHHLRRHQNRQVEFDPHLFWRFKPNQTLDHPELYLKPVRINSRGFRGRDWEDEKPAGVFRVACLGDSTTFGWSVGEDETYPAQLQRLLDAECGPGRFEVLNLGVTGYTSLQGRELMLRHAAEWEPDFVVFAFGPNDRLPALNSDLDHLEQGTWDKSRTGLVLHRSQLYKLLVSLAVYLERRREGLSLDPATFIPRLKRKVSPSEFADNAAAVKAACDEIGCRLILVNVDYPSLPPDHVGREWKKQAAERGVTPAPDWPDWDGSALIRELGGELSAAGIDLRALFEEKLALIGEGRFMHERFRDLRSADPEKYDSEPWRLLMVDNGHPNRFGHRLIAEELLSELRKLDGFARACGGRD